jgi:O-antigen/teichoic acid export membrane protein
VIGFSIVLLLNIVLTPRYLQFGAVNASLIGHLFIAATGYYLSQKFYKIPFRFGRDIPVFIFFLTFSILAVNFHTLPNTYADIGVKTVILGTCAFLILSFVFREEYKKSLDMLSAIRIKAKKRMS